MVLPLHNSFDILIFLPSYIPKEKTQRNICFRIYFTRKQSGSKTFYGFGWTLDITTFDRFEPFLSIFVVDVVCSIILQSNDSKASPSICDRSSYGFRSLTTAHGRMEKRSHRSSLQAKHLQRVTKRRKIASG